MKLTAPRILLPALITVCAMIPASAGAQTSPKEYILFEGANIAVHLDTSNYPVRDVFGASWVVDINGQDKAISAKDAPVDLKISPALKLTEESATISDFKREPGYTFANDPAVKMTRGMNAAADVNAGYQAAASQASAIDPIAIRTDATTSSGSGDSASVLAASSAKASATIASANAGSDASNAMQGNGTTSAGYDAMNVEFGISSAKTLQDPYIVTMT
jgi:hypothetical protein